MRKRNKRVGVRLNETEFAEMEKKRAKTGFSREAYLRQVIANGTVREAPPADYPKLLTALSRIGNNLNQIAAAANAVRYISPDALRQTQEELDHILKEIHHIFLIPDKIQISKKTISDLQYIYMETRKVLFGLEKSIDTDTVICYIKNAIEMKATQDNALMQEERRQREWQKQLEEVPTLYVPFQEAKE